MNLKLSNCEVVLKENLTWYQMQEVQAVVNTGAKMGTSGLSGFDGEAMLKAKIKLIGLIVEKVVIGDKTQSFSEDWLKSLPMKDGNLLEVKIDEISKKNQ